MRLFLLTALLCGAAGWTPTAHAQSDDDVRARELYRNGEDLYNEGRYEEAVLAWRDAYELSDRPKILFNIANAYERMGELGKAVDELFRYKAFATADQRPQIERRIRALEQRIDANKAVEPDPVPVPTPTPTPSPTPKPETPVRGGGSAPVGGIVLLGVGAAALGAGGVFGLSSNSAKKRANAFCMESGDDLFCTDEANDDLKAHRNNAVIADIGFAVGAVATGTGIILISTHKGAKASLGISPNRVRIFGRF